MTKEEYTEQLSEELRLLDWYKEVTESRKENSLAEYYWNATSVKNHVEDMIWLMHVVHDDLNFVNMHFSGDNYDYSVEIYFEQEIDKSWIPSEKLIEGIKSLGFTTIYWNFINGEEISTCNGLKRTMRGT